MALTTHTHLAQRLRKSRAIPLLPICAYMVFYGQTFTFTLNPSSGETRILFPLHSMKTHQGLICNSVNH
jgi:hypothetical protein